MKINRYVFAVMVVSQLVVLWLFGASTLNYLKREDALKHQVRSLAQTGPR